MGTQPTQEELMQAMIANQAATAPIQPLPEMPVMMPNMPGMAPVGIVAQTTQPLNVAAPIDPTVMAQLAAQANPVMAPNPVEETQVPQVIQTMPEMPVVQQQAPALQVAQMAPTTQEQAAVMQTQNVGTALNLQNGLDLDSVMTPEEQVKLEVAEVQANPIVIGGLESIGSCKTSVWAALITILDFISKDLSNNDIIAIEKGTIDTQRDGIFIHCNMQNILGNISLNITAPDKSVKLLKLIKGGELVQIFKEEATNHYVFCNIQESRVLTRVKTSFAADQVDGFGKAPHLGNPIFQKEIPQNEKEVIKTIIAGKSAIGGSDEPYRFGFSKEDGTLVSIGVGKDFTHFFKDSSIEINEYRCYNPFPVPNMDSCIIRFFKKTDDNTTWIQTVSNINPSSIICTEKVELIDSSIEDFNFA